MQVLDFSTFIAKVSCLAGCVLLLICPGCDVNFQDVAGIEGSGVEETKEFDVEPFEEVTFTGAGTFNVKCGEDQSVKVTFDDNLMEYVECNVVDGRMRIEVTKGYSTKKAMQVDITVPKLTKARVSGAGNATITNCSGEQVTFEVSGAAVVTADGTVDKVVVDASGACSLRLAELTAKECVVDMSGAGSSRVHADEKLTVKLSGVASVKYSGEPEVDKSISGIGSVSKVD